MSEQDVIVENEAVEVTEDVKVETPSEKTDEVVEQKEQEPEKTVEERLVDIENDNKGKQAKIDRQKAAYTSLQEKYEKQIQEMEALRQAMPKDEQEAEPNIDDFETHDEYVNAQVEYRTKKLFDEQQKDFIALQQQAQQQQIMQERMKLRQEQEAEFMVDNPMYKASASEVDGYIRTLQVPDNTASAILDVLYDGNIAQVINHFGSNNGENLGELERITKLPPHRAAVEMYKIQQRITNPVAKEKKTTPKPVKEPTSKSNSSKPLGKKSGEEILAWVNS